jgi:3-hydroxyisobutyrate dehydrogenase
MNIAFIGLGNMGLPMAANLLKAGHKVAGFDMNPAACQAHGGNGGRVAGSVADAIADAEIVITMLPAGKHVREVVAGQVLPALTGGTALLIDCSTIDVDTAREVAASAATAGLAFIDAPVSGGVVGATAASLTFMVGGADDAVARAMPVLKAMGANIVHAGGPGAGQAAKICNNMLLGIAMLGVAEAFVLADKLGLDRQKLFDISSVSSGSCWALLHNCPVPGPVAKSAANRDYTPGFAAALMLKDMGLSQQAASSVGAATPLGAHAAKLYERVVADGEGGRDFSIVFPWLSAQKREA